jgi:serine/threonine protein kinase
MDPNILWAAVRGIMEALTAIHARGLCHCDIKPANMLLPVLRPGYMGPAVKLADFDTCTFQGVTGRGNLHP